jgi:hypothetical protein
VVTRGADDAALIVSSFPVLVAAGRSQGMWPPATLVSTLVNSVVGVATFVVLSPTTTHGPRLGCRRLL